MKNTRPPKAQKTAARPHRAAHPPAPRAEKPRGNTPAKAPNTFWLVGVHAVKAALKNPARRIHRLRIGVKKRSSLMYQEMDFLASARKVKTDYVEQFDFLERGETAAHQECAVEVSPLAAVDLHDFLETLPAGDHAILVLDQVTDPHNAGACLRAAAALGALAVIVPEAGAAHESAALAKTASGALDIIPLIAVANLARALETLKKNDFWIYGLAEEGTATPSTINMRGRIAWVMGAEGDGLRHLTKQHCDTLMRLPTDDRLPTLNVATAAAVTLYAWKNAARGNSQG